MEKVVSTKTCRQCQKQFSITDRDMDFYKKVDVPPATLCSDCRQEHRLLRVNQLYLFQRECDVTSEPIISNFPPDSPYRIYSQKYWYSDQFDATEYGRDFDFGRPFFEQFAELSLVVPRPALFTDFLHDENSAYTNYAGKNKNCYLIFDSDENWDCYYSYGMNGSRTSSDCYRVQNLELCYEVSDSKNCYNCAFVYNSENCSDSMFLNNCVGVKNSIMCSNLVQKEYHILNKPVSKEEYEEFRVQMGSYEFVKNKLAEFKEFKKQFPQKYMRGFQNENVTGNHIVNCKNAMECFDSMNLWDAKYCTQMFMKSKDCMDCDELGDVELAYNSSNSGYNGYNLRFVVHCLDQISNLTYCDYCFRSSYLFGCVGLKGKKYCILNKQYTNEEYEALVSRIIEHMRKTGEWGEYFPSSSSPFPYNLTVAQDHLPLTREEILAKGYSFKDQDPREYQPQSYVISDNISQVQHDITVAILACESCGRNYKIVSQELDFYRQKGLPIPRNCFYCRYKARMSMRTGRVLYDRKCMKCGSDIRTAYAPTEPDRVYCEKCYVGEVF